MDRRGFLKALGFLTPLVVFFGYFIALADLVDDPDRIRKQVLAECDSVFFFH